MRLYFVIKLIVLYIAYFAVIPRIAEHVRKRSTRPMTNKSILTSKTCCTRTF